MKIRRIYKRDKDGQFARVNSLLGAAADAAKKKRLKSKANSLNRVPSKSDGPRVKLSSIKPQILEAAAGKLSLAEGPAREIAKKHDLSGHNRSEANKAAYRECAKYARELKAKYGADAPTADRIYSAAKLIQRGGDLGAKIREEEGDGAVKPQPPKPKPDAPKPPTGTKKPANPKPKGNTILPLNKLEGLNTKDLIEQYDLADQTGSERVKSRALQWLKARAKTGDADALAWFEGNPNGPKIDPPSINELNKRIARALSMLRSSPTSEEKQIYQDKIDNLNAAIRDRLDKGTIEELSKDLKDAQRELVKARGDVTTYKSRINRFGDSNGGYTSMLENAKRDVNVSLGTVKRLQERIAELKGQAKAEGEKVAALKKKGFSQLPRNDDTAPPAVRIAREAKVRNAFDGWFAGYRTMSLDNENEAAGNNFVDWKDKFKEDEAFRKKMIAEFVATLKNPSPLNNREGSWTYRELTERNGYNDLTPQQRKTLADSDGKLLEKMFEPKFAEARMENGFKNWLETSDSAYDLAKNYDYDTDSLFEIFMDGNESFRWRDEYINNYDIADRYRKFFRESKFDGAALARLPRPEKVKPEDAAPVPYRAKSNSVGELRREKESREKELAFGMTKVFGNAETFGKLTPEQQDAERAKYRKMMDEVVNLGDRIKAKSPDLSRSMQEAKDFDDAFNIFSDRNPGVALSGWAGEGSAIELTMEKAGVYSPEHRKIILARVIENLEAAEEMHKKYPEVPFDGFNARERNNFSKDVVMAHCARGVWINIEINTDYLVNKSPTSGAEGFHPKDFTGKPWANTVIHEFGHSMDWFAFGIHDIANDRSLQDRNDGKGVRRDKIWDHALNDVMSQRDQNLRKIMVDLYRKYKDEGLFSGTYDEFYEKYTSGYARTNYHELIAESWQDVESNGALATPISQAIAQFVLNNYNRRVKEGKAAPYVIKTTN